jgi:hypothetical protein
MMDRTAQVSGTSGHVIEVVKCAHPITDDRHFADGLVVMIYVEDGGSGTTTLHSGADPGNFPEANVVQTQTRVRNVVERFMTLCEDVAGGMGGTRPVG